MYLDIPGVQTLGKTVRLSEAFHSQWSRYSSWIGRCELVIKHLRQR